MNKPFFRLISRGTRFRVATLLMIVTCFAFFFASLSYRADYRDVRREIHRDLSLPASPIEMIDYTSGMIDYTSVNVQGMEAFAYMESARFLVQDHSTFRLITAIRVGAGPGDKADWDFFGCSGECPEHPRIRLQKSLGSRWDFDVSYSNRPTKNQIAEFVQFSNECLPRFQPIDGTWRLRIQN